jgi:glucose/arabinose dehydrogenase
MRFALLPSVAALVAAPLFFGCPSSSTPKAAGGTTGTHPDAATGPFCSLPGSLQFTSTGTVTVPGGKGTDVLAFLTLPVGFFAPGGELFVASPITGTTGGGPNGNAAIMVLPDDDHDGLADSNISFLGALPSTQGLLFANSSFYYQDATRIMKMPYASGERAPSGSASVAVDITFSTDQLHWPKTLDISDDGKIYVGNGGGQNDPCIEPHPTKGAVVALDGTPGGTPVSKGFRNPIAIRCAKGHNQCFALELAKDYTAGEGGREKLVPIRNGDDWGFPCCATQNLPYTMVVNQDNATPDCSAVAAESNAFLIGDTPFGLDFAPSTWPSTYAGSALVATHGAAGSWKGTRIVAIPVDASTGLPKTSTNTSGTDEGMTDFATGWDDSVHPNSHGRAAAVTFSPDGRLFVGNDWTGDVFWIAPM